MKKLLLFCLFLSHFQLFAQEAAEQAVSTDTIPAGVQGSINPLTDNRPVHTGDNLLDDSFPSSWPLFGSDVRLRKSRFY
ncbi:hypothetical protein KFZ70_11955 [Tamlana fucoidanivorans]|uniref:Uncharacterized protein n=1 Tax=Allotamlana fucoidanivorans TaxID=2583814 RepID=A0A5C4SNW7_9FLAO|nr:hypothetical protein [Tamlana fucoidanivorans]TNJ45004.1 hypothetical protein FGF67_07565 [Tamlana fucoidanivorans]